jgi:hypothetical protein
MEITTGFIHILKDWETVSNRVNDVIRYNMTINHHRIALCYTKINGLENQLSITWHVGNRDIIVTFDVKEINKKYYMSTYIPNDSFAEIKGTFDFNETSPVNSFMSDVFNHIPATHPVIYDYNLYRQEHLAMHFQHDTDKPFFNCFIRKNISPEMQRKIKRKYTNADEIITFCINYNQTLRFTSDIAHAKEFSVEFRNKKSEFM